METRLDPRLACAAQFVRQGAVFADIGTDHAYLPIALVQRNAVLRAVAADVAQKPLESARAHLAVSAEENPALRDRIDLVLTDGLAGLEHYSPHITDIAICGMGGELIARILSDAPFVRDPDIRLILQPMTMQPYLRRWLGANGFETTAERLCRTANGKLYSVLCVQYTGNVNVPCDADALLGEKILSDSENRDFLREYLLLRRENLAKIVSGRTSAGQGAECTAEAAALARAEELLVEM